MRVVVAEAGVGEAADPPDPIAIPALPAAAVVALRKALVEAAVAAGLEEEAVEEAVEAAMASLLLPHCSFW
jgi:hypothetical protein